MKRNIQILSLFVLSITIISCGVLLNNKKFEIEKWKNGDERVRGEMSYDLQKSNLLIGKNAVEVRQILGEPNYKSEMEKNPLLDRYLIDTKTIIDGELDVHYDLEKKTVTSVTIGS